MYAKLLIVDLLLSIKPLWISFDGRSRILSIAFLLIPLRIFLTFHYRHIMIYYFYSLKFLYCTV